MKRLASVGLLAVTSMGSAAAVEQGEVVVEMVAEDGKGRAIADLRSEEVVLAQDGVLQVVRAFRFVPEPGYYELRYVPESGRSGAVAVRVTRDGARLRGPDGPQLKVRWVPPVAEFEKPLRSALDASAPPTGFDFGMDVLRFETRGDTLHHTVLAEIPFAQVLLQPGRSGSQAHLAFFLRVKATDGRIVQEGSLDQPLEVGPVVGAQLGVRRFVWSSDVFLRPGHYSVEVAAGDQLASKTAVRRMPLTVEPNPPGLRVGSLVFLLGVGGTMAGPGGADDPLRLQDTALVPMLRPTLVAGSQGPSSLVLVAYPDRRSGEPLSGWIELHREGQLRARTAAPLPPPDQQGRVRTALAVKFSSMQPGDYVVKFVAQQGEARAEASTTVTVTLPPRMN